VTDVDGMAPPEEIGGCLNNRDERGLMLVPEYEWWCEASAQLQSEGGLKMHVCRKLGHLLWRRNTDRPFRGRGRR